MILIITHIDIESGDEGEQADCDDEDMNLLDELGKLSKCQKENCEEKNAFQLNVWMSSQFVHNVFLMM